MNSHAVVTQQLLNQQQTLPASYTISAVNNHPQNEMDLQDKINQIAQPKHPGYEMGVALRKAIDNLNKFCDNLARHFASSGVNFWDYLFSSDGLYTAMKDTVTTYEDNIFVKLCKKSVADLEQAAGPRPR